MSLSDFLTPEDRAGVPWAGCLHCRFRENCAHFQTSVRTEALLRAARQDRRLAQYLQDEADRYGQSVALAEDARTLLDAGDTLEDALNQVQRTISSLHGELFRL